MKTLLYLITATIDTGIILREVFEDEGDALSFERTELKSQLCEMYGDDIKQNTSLQLGCSVLELHMSPQNIENSLIDTEHESNAHESNAHESNAHESNAFEVAATLKRLSEYDDNPRIKNVLFTAADLLCKQQGNIQEVKQKLEMYTANIDSAKFLCWNSTS